MEDISETLDKLGTNIYETECFITCLSKLFESDDLKYKNNSYLKPLIDIVKTKNTKALEYYDKIELFVTKILLNVD